MIYTLENITFLPKSRHKLFHDLTNHVYGRLTVIGYAGRAQQYRHQWWCQCECGNIHKASGSNLTKGHTQSCGCLHREITTKRNTIHGDAKRGQHTPEYEAYIKARQRCLNPKNRKYHRYGKRGVEMRFNSFKEFLAEVGIRPSNQHSLNRIDNNGHYEKGNVNWALPTEQSRNREITRKLTWNGITHSVAKWSEICNISIGAIYRRISRKWCMDCILTVKPHHSCPHRLIISSIPATTTPAT